MALKYDLRVALLFALFGVLWVLLTDWLLLWLVPGLPAFGMWQTGKGWLYVGLSSLFLFLLLRVTRRATFGELAQSEARYRLLFENNPLPMWVYDVQTLAFLAVNEAAVNAYGYSRAEFLRMTLRQIRPPQDVARLETDVAQTRQQLNFAGQWRHQRRDGAIFPVEVVSHELEYNGRLARLVVVHDLTQQEQAEAALRESEARFRKAVEESPLPTVIHAEDGQILTLSRAWTEITGYEAAEIPTVAAWTERAYGERQEAMQASIDRLYALDRREDEREFEVRCKDGSRRVWVFSSTPLGPLPDGRRTVISVAMDMTSRIEAAQRLRLQSAALEATASTIVITDVDGRIEWVNTAFNRLTGYTREEALEKNPRDLVKSGRHGQAFYKAMWETILSGRVWQGEIINRRKDGTLYVEEQTITPVRNEAGEIAHFVAIKQDISARKEAEAEREQLLAQVQAQAEQLAQIMASVPEGICLLDDAGVVLAANGNAREQLALLGQAGVGHRLARIGEQPLPSLLTSPPRGEWHETEANGHHFRILARPLESGPVAQGWVMVIWEVTEQLLVQRQLQQQERLAAVGQLAAGIAHDFNNIMAVIVLYADLLKRAAGLSERERERLYIIRSQADRAAHLIQQILDFSRQAVLEQRPLDLLPLLKEETKLLQRTLPEHIEIVLRYDAPECFVLADPTRMQQVIMNLALNARDAMPSGGRLRWTLDEVQINSEKKAPLPQMKAGKWVRLRVADTGGGIAPATLDRVFEPFFTTKAPGVGAGLGLAQVHGIVVQHGGHVTIDSEVGAGTTVTIYLPALAMVTAVSPQDETAESPPQGHGELALVVEDNDVLREALVETLQRWGYQTLAATDGREALALLQVRSEEIDLIISDVVMPKLGGTGLLREVQRQGWHIPAILLTGHPQKEEVTDSRFENVAMTLTKPVDLKRLAQMIKQVLGNNDS